MGEEKKGDSRDLELRFCRCHGVDDDGGGEEVMADDKRWH
jgi:hypothetical protein